MMRTIVPYRAHDNIVQQRRTVIAAQRQQGVERMCQDTGRTGFQRIGNDGADIADRGFPVFAGGHDLKEGAIG